MGAARTTTETRGVTLDAGALIALERGDGRMTALMRALVLSRRRFRVPAGVVGQVWRGGARQAVLARFLRSMEVEIVPLDDRAARACGELCGAAGTADVVDASVILTARAHQDIIVTSDSDDLRRLDPTAVLQPI